ncbi:Cochlin [Exaiptasia diaphana]|nr:Cochlin [Exaiptasia diaphana]
MKFADSTDEKKVLNVVDGIPYQNSGTKTGNAIVAAGNLLFSQSREKVRKVLIVLTEGGSTDDDIGPAKALKQAGVEIFVIGLGKTHTKKRLFDMATDGRHVFMSDFKSLKAIEQTIKDMVCEPPTITYKCQCDCCGDVYTCTQDDVKAGCKCSN